MESAQNNFKILKILVTEMCHQARENDKYLRQNIEPEQPEIVSTQCGTHKYTQNLKITGTLHNEWKRNNLLGDFEFFLQ